VLEKGIEVLKSKVSKGIRRIWAPYDASLLKAIAHFHPTVESEAAELGKSIEPSGKSLEKDIETIINELQEKKMRSHHEAIGPTLQDGLRAIFNDAFNIKGWLTHVLTLLPKECILTMLQERGSSRHNRRT
jgi:hypothetical protein